VTSLPAAQDGLAGRVTAAPLPPERKPLYIGLDLNGTDEAAAAFARMALSLLDGPDEAVTAAAPLTTPELATALGWPLAKTRRALTEGLMPGCFKENPAKKGSHWYIPPDTPARYRRGERGTGGHGGA
jgi:hypothetical protein